MTTRRALLATVGVVPVLHIHRTEQDQSLSQAYPHPDAALLALCARLEGKRAEWQRLWLLTSDGPGLATEADHAWQAYSDTAWPGIAVSDPRAGAPATDRFARQAAHPTRHHTGRPEGQGKGRDGAG
jgi:hypothetical protein